MIELISAIALQRPVVILLDGLDHIRMPELNWLPWKLPNNAKLIISARTDSLLFRQFKMNSPIDKLIIEVISFKRKLPFLFLTYCDFCIQLFCYLISLPIRSPNLAKLKLKDFFYHLSRSTVIRLVQRLRNVFCRLCSTAAFLCT